MPDVLTHPSHIGYHHQWSLLLLLSIIQAACVCCFLCGWDQSVADKVCRVSILFEDSSKVVKFLLKIVLRVDPSDPLWYISPPLSSHGSTDGTQSGDTSPCVWTSCRPRHLDCHPLFS